MKQELEKLCEKWANLPYWCADNDIESSLRQFLREALASEDLLWRYYNDSRFHAFVRLRCAESIEAYKDHKQPDPDEDCDSHPSVLSARLRSVPDTDEAALAMERLRHEVSITKDSWSELSRDIITVCNALRAARQQKA